MTALLAAKFKEHIFLFSDGRVTINNNSGEQIPYSDSHGKVHKVTRFVGCLSGGRFIPELIPSLIKICQEKNGIYINDIKSIIDIWLTQWWNEAKKNISIIDLQVFVIHLFFIGINKNKQIQLFCYSINRNNCLNIECIEEKQDNECNFAYLDSISSDSSELINNIVECLRNKDMRLDSIECVTSIYLECFTKFITELSKRTVKIGSNIFAAIIDSVDGFHYIRKY